MTEIPLSAALMEQFNAWMDEAEAAEPSDPNAMSLATATPHGIPSVRIVLMKGFGADGVRFFTNLESRKGRELAENPVAALLFHWKSTKRQVRFEGRLQRLSADDNQAYFDSRGRGSRIGAWSSDQSRPIESRDVLETKVSAKTAEFAGKHIPCPPFWGGYRLVPHRIEFWSDRADRLHDRTEWQAIDGEWISRLLQP